VFDEKFNKNGSSLVYRSKFFYAKPSNVVLTIKFDELKSLDVQSWEPSIIRNRAGWKATSDNTESLAMGYRIICQMICGNLPDRRGKKNLAITAFLNPLRTLKTQGVAI